MKRAVDVVASAAGLAVAGLPMMVIAAAVRRSMGSPVLFVQMRPGLHGELFAIRKFRTMRDATDENGDPLPDEERLTPLGRFLRGTSLDELPELVNVLRGDMSLVGPRPLLPQYLPRYTERQARRHEVRPGVTGLAQVSGRNALSWDDRFELDVYYVDHWSLLLDLQILGRTLLQVVRRDGISQPGHATAEEFMGSGDVAA